MVAPDSHYLISNTHFNQLPLPLQNTLSQQIASGWTTPLILICKEIIQSNLQFFAKALTIPLQNIFFAVKANNDSAVLQWLDKLGASFEIASLGELNLLKQLNIHSSRILYSNPVKIPYHITVAHAYGIRRFAFDTEEELNTISRYAPHSAVYLRFNVNNQGATWQLAGKFGVPPEDAVVLLKKALSFNLTPVGITFHVGWDNKQLPAWRYALDKAVQIVQACHQQGLSLQFVNLGGGFPAHAIDNQYQGLQDIQAAVSPLIAKLRDEFKLAIYAEPGSFITHNSAVLIMSIYSIVQRATTKWIFVDSTINQGFIWIYGGVRYQIFPLQHTPAESVLEKFTITGPTCDSADVFGKEVLLPNTLKVGDYLCVYPAGSYTNSSKSYNGFDFPSLHIV